MVSAVVHPEFKPEGNPDRSKGKKEGQHIMPVVILRILTLLFFFFATLSLQSGKYCWTIQE